MRTLRRKISGLGAVTLATFCLLAATGCAGGAGAKTVHADGKAALTSEEIVLERGYSAQNRPWQLRADEQGGQLGLYLENPAGRGYSGAVGFAAGVGLCELECDAPGRLGSQRRLRGLLTLTDALRTGKLPTSMIWTDVAAGCISAALRCSCR